jgi:hypothetical protein
MPAASVQGHARDWFTGPPVMTTVPSGRPEMAASIVSRSVRRRLPTIPDPHVTAPVIHRNADAEAPGPRRAINDSWACLPSRGRQIVDQDHRGARLGDAPKRRQLGELPRVAVAGAQPVGEHLKEGEAESRGNGLGDLLTEAIRPPRVAAGLGAPLVGIELRQDCLQGC